MPDYIVMEGKGGRPCVRGPFSVPGEAQRRLDKSMQKGEVYTLNTRNLNEAIRKLKEMRVFNLGVDKGMVRFRRKFSDSGVGGTRKDSYMVLADRLIKKGKERRRE
jgi:hypothetical protein